jgi:hypothetical protein
VKDFELASDEFSVSAEEAAEQETRSQHAHENLLAWCVLSEVDREELTERGYDKETIAALRFGSCTDGDGRAILKWPEGMQGSAAGLLLPYLTDATGRWSGYGKVRPYQPRPEDPKAAKALRKAIDRNEHEGAAGPTETDYQGLKRRKYEAVFNEPYRPYIPWPLLAGVNEESDVLLTEGEHKAALLAQALQGENVMVIGVPGVSMTHCQESKVEALRSGDADEMKEGELAPTLRERARPGRRFLWGYDSPDMDGTNPSVVRECVKACRRTAKAGADPWITYVPTDRNGGKRGVDDWLLDASEQLARENRGTTVAYWRKQLARQYIASALPANPVDQIEHLARANAEDRRLEALSLKRTVVWACAWYSDEESLLKQWCSQLVKLKLARKEDVEKALDRVPTELRKPKKKKPEAFTWVLRWLETNKVKYDYAGGGGIIDGNAEEGEVLLARLELASTKEETAISVRNIRNSVLLWERQERKRIVDAVRQEVAYRGSGKAVEAFVAAVTRKEVPDALDVAVLRQFIWLVKRKLNVLPVERHLMPVLYGKQEGGKTTAIQQLLVPLGPLASFPSDMHFLGDERQLFRLARTYACCFDEMAKAERVDVESLKNKITSATVEWRVMATNKLQSGRNTATFIAGSNRPIKELILDATGMRRFYQINCAPELDWHVINNLDYWTLWQSVDEQAQAPITPFLAVLRQHQEGLRAKDSVEEFIEQCCNPVGWSGGKSLYESYAEWMRLQGRQNYMFSMTKFGERMKDLLGPEGIGWKQSNGVKYAATPKPYNPDIGCDRPAVN